MKILVINCGSSSVKYQLIQMDGPEVLASGLVERIGEPEGAITHKKHPGQPDEWEIELTLRMDTHTAGLTKVVELLCDPKEGVISKASDIAAVGHRVLHGGEQLYKPSLVNEEVIKIIEDNIPLGPLHNPPNLQGILVAQKLFEGIPQVAIFDTAFHQTMPPEAFMYALPYDLYTDRKVRKYGFHGTSHKYVAAQTAKQLGKPLDELNAITVHLGNGSSMAAVKNGKCFDTTMGLTPLAGLVMGTRCGDVDPAIVSVAAEHYNLDFAQVDDLMNRQSGFKGVCGLNDMRDIHAAIAKGDKRAKLALNMFVHRIKLYLGGYYALLGRVDAVVFTAGIGENDSISRRLICSEMEHFGLEIDQERNDARSREARFISKDGSKTAILVIPTNEELEIANQTVEVLHAESLI
ncbi:MAG: acetate kinase [Desulfovibrionales bacterium]|nr:acetate kinase [Desulfovibrionales bacterium]